MLRNQPLVIPKFTVTRLPAQYIFTYPLLSSSISEITTFLISPISLDSLPFLLSLSNILHKTSSISLSRLTYNCSLYLAVTLLRHLSFKHPLVSISRTFSSRKTNPCGWPYSLYDGRILPPFSLSMYLAQKLDQSASSGCRLAGKYQPGMTRNK